MILFYPESIQVLGTDANGANVILCKMAVDDIANLPAYNAFAPDNVLSMGCTAIAINDNSKHRLNSAGQWIQIQAGTSTYTRAEIDAFVNAQNALNVSMQTEINYSINTGCKNYCPYEGYTAENAGTVINDEPINLNSGTYTMTFNHTATTGSTAFRLLYNGTSIVTFTINNTETGTKSREFTLPSPANQFRVYTSGANTVTNLMIRPSIITDTTFQPYAPSNRELYEMIRGYHP